AATAAGRIAALRHEAGDHAVKGHAVVETFARQEDEVVHRLRRVFGEQLDHDVALVRVQRGAVLLVRVDRHRRRCTVLSHRTSFARCRGLPLGAGAYPLRYCLLTVMLLICSAAGAFGSFGSRLGRPCRMSSPDVTLPKTV